MKMPLIHPLIALLFSFFLFNADLKSQILTPTQPLLGPGGKAAEIHADFDSAFYGNKIEDQFWLFEPKSPKPNSAPVVFFWHGSYSGKASQLGAILAPDLFEYIKRGYIVVAPLYEHGDYEPSASKKIELFGSVTKAALAELEKPNHIPAQKDNEGRINYGCVGYSLGGMVFAGANNYKVLGIHPPKAIVGMLPFGHQEHVPYSNIPSTTKVALVSSDGDISFLKAQADTMHWPGLAHIPCNNKVYVYAQSGGGLIADHLFPLRIAVNSLDYYVAWKYTFGMMDCALKDKNCEYVLTNRDSITFTGLFSNSRPARPLIIKDGACEAVTAALQQIDENQKLVIYNNPAQEKLILNFKNQGEYLIKITDLNGVLRITDSATEPNHKVGLENLKAGIYLLEIENDNQRIKRDKLIVK